MEDADFHVPHYQRLSTSGEDCTGVPIEDLKSASEMLVKAIAVRQRYMKVSKQQFPSFGDRFLAAYNGEVYQKPRDIAGKATIEGEGNNLKIKNFYNFLKLLSQTLYLFQAMKKVVCFNEIR